MTTLGSMPLDRAQDISAACVAVTFDGPPETHTISPEQLRAYLTSKGWRKEWETDRDDNGRELGCVVEGWFRDVGRWFAPVWATHGHLWRRGETTIRAIAKIEGRAPIYVLREIAAGGAR